MKRCDYVVPKMNVVELEIEQIVATSTEIWGTVDGGASNERKERPWGCLWSD